MNRYGFHAMLAQYALAEKSGQGRVSWEGGIACVLPGLRLTGGLEQDAAGDLRPNNAELTLVGKNLLCQTGQPSGMSGLSVSYDSGSGVFTLDGTTQDTGEAILSLGMPLLWELGQQYHLVRQQAGGSVTLPEGACLLWTLRSGESSLSTREDGDSQAQALLRAPAEEVAAFAPAGEEGYTLLLQCQGGGIVFDQYQVRLMVVPAQAEVSRYEPFWQGGTVQAPNLWAIPGSDYVDQWDAATGQGVRRCALLESYAGEALTTPWVSSTGALTQGARVLYGIEDTPFALRQRLLMPDGPGAVVQTGGEIDNVALTVQYLTHS